MWSKVYSGGLNSATPQALRTNNSLALQDHFPFFECSLSPLSGLVGNWGWWLGLRGMEGRDR